MLSGRQISQIEQNILTTGRPLEKAKLACLMGGEKAAVQAALLQYQNPDGGFGGGCEIDTLSPASAAIGASEALKVAQDYELDLHAEWMGKLLKWLENTVSDIPAYWDLFPANVENYPHMRYVNYRRDRVFTPHVCAIFVPVLVLYGTPSQRRIGEEILDRCLWFITTEQPTWQFEIKFLQRMYLWLTGAGYPFEEQTVRDYLIRKVDETVCRDEEKWRNFVALPLDLIRSPKAPWCKGFEREIEQNFRYWIDTLQPDGTWPYKKDWDTSTPELAQISRNWSGFFAVDKLLIFKRFGML